MTRTFLFLLFIFIAGIGRAQSTKGYEEGYVVTNAGDTVKGEIKHKSGDEIKDRVYLRISEEDKRNYKASEIKSFTAGNESYISYDLEGEQTFLLEWAIGYLELYEEQIPSTTEGVFSYQPYIRKAGEKELVAVKTGGWKKQILAYISDYTDLAGDIDKNKYKLEDLGKVIQLYNEWKDEQ